MKWLWEKRYALISLYVIATFAISYIIKLLLDGAAYFLSVLPAFFHGVGDFFGRLAGIFAPLIIAIVIAYLLDPAVDFFQRAYDKVTAEKTIFKNKRRKKEKGFRSRAAGATLTYATLFLLTGMLVWWTIHRLNLHGDYMSGLTYAMDRTRNQFSETYAAFQVRLREMGLLENLKEYLDQIINGVGMLVQSAGYTVLNSVSSVGGSIFNALMGLIMAFYILSGKERIFKGMRELSIVFLPYRFRTGARNTLKDMNAILSGYIRGQLTDVLIMAVLISVWLSVISVDFAVIIGIFTGLLNIIPYFGSLIGFLVSVAVAFIGGNPMKALYTAIGLLVLQQVDGLYINPRVVGKNVELSPLLVIVALTAGGALFGIPGMILAVPVCAIIKMFLSRYVDYRREKIKEARENECAKGQGENGGEL